MTDHNKPVSPEDSLIARYFRPIATPEWARRGYAHLFNETILQADEGCDFDFMRGEGKG